MDKVLNATLALLSGKELTLDYMVSHIEARMLPIEEIANIRGMDFIDDYTYQIEELLATRDIRITYFFSYKIFQSNNPDINHKIQYKLSLNKFKLGSGDVEDYNDLVKRRKHVKIKSLFYTTA